MFLLVFKVVVIAILAILGIVLAVFLGLLLFPFKIKGNFQKDEALKAEINLSWLRSTLGSKLVFLPQTTLVEIRLWNRRIFVRSVERKPTKAPKKHAVVKQIEKEITTKEQPEEKKKEKRKRFSLSEKIEQITNITDKVSMEALQEIISFLINFFNSLQLSASGKAEVGLSNPADTGMLLGFFYAICGVLHIKNFSLQPNWDDLSIQGTVNIAARLWLVHVLSLTIRTLLAKSIRKIWWPYVKQAINPFGRTKPQTA